MITVESFSRFFAMHLVQILLPCTDNERQPFPREDFARVKQQLGNRFEGVTAWLQAPAEGLWSDGRSTDRDDIVIFEVMTDEIDFEEWRRRRADLERQFRQEKVVFRYLPMALV